MGVNQTTIGSPQPGQKEAPTSAGRSLEDCAGFRRCVFAISGSNAEIRRHRHEHDSR